ncbi:MAG: hypothetical protein WDO71_05680 [Bacteroidota bacterium]
MRKSVFLVVILFTGITCFAQVKVQSLLTENLIDPVGLDTRKPRFSWQLQSDLRNVLQTAYEIKVSSGEINCLGQW